jgi:hypothetical protein
MDTVELNQEGPTIRVGQLRDFLKDLPDDMEVFLTSTLVRPMISMETSVLANCVRKSVTTPVALERAWQFHKVEEDTARTAVVLGIGL